MKTASRDSLLSVLNRREEAIVFWLLVLIAWGLTRREVRASAAQVLRTFLAPKVGGVVLAAAAYTTLVLWVLSRAEYWDRSMLKDSIYWFAGIGVVTLVNLHGKDERHLRRVVLDTLTLTTAFVFLVNVYVFPLLVELLFVPLMFIAASSLAVADAKRELASVRRLLQGVMTFVGAILLVFAVSHVLSDWQNFASSETLRDFLLPSLLTAAFLPFLWIFALVIAYELIFLRVRFALPRDGTDRKIPSRLLLLIVRSCGLRLGRIHRFTPDVMPKLFAAESAEEMERGVRAWKPQSSM